MKLTEAEFLYLRAFWEESSNLVRGPARRNMPTEPSAGYIHGKLCSLLAVLERTEKCWLEAVLERMGRMETNPVPAGDPVWPWQSLKEFEDRSNEADAYLERQKTDIPIIREEGQAENSKEKVE